MSFEKINNSKDDFICNINAEYIYQESAVVMSDVSAGDQENRICEYHIKKYQVSREFTVIDPFAETLALKYCSSSCPVEDVYSQHADKEMIDSHDEEP